MLNGNTVLQPTTYDLLSKHRSRLLDNLNKVKVGIIQSFDATKRTASIQISFQTTQNDGAILSYPLLVNCPVLSLQGGGKGFSAPISAGDECVVLFSDQSLDTWFELGGSQPPVSSRVHDLSDGIAVVGLNSLANPIKYALLSGEVGMSDGVAKVAANSGLVTVANGTTTLLTLLTNFISLLETLTVLDDETSTPLPLTAASIAALEAFKAQFSTLLY
jgi:hypothetical protein